MSLRERLRLDTRAAHDVVDSGFEQFDLSSAPGYRAFLACHQSALRQVLATCGSHTQLVGDVREKLDRLAKDLAVLGHRPRHDPVHPARRLHPTSLEYVLLGSNMGMRVLHKRWLKIRHPGTDAASGFLSAPLELSHWQMFCTALSKIPDHGPEADTIVADALSVFSIYTQAAKDLSLSHAGA